MRKIISIWTLFALLLFGKGCTEIIDIDLDSSYTRLVVYGSITTDSLHHGIQLSSSTDYFYNESPPPVRNAEISITMNDSTVSLVESQLFPGYYSFPDAFRGKPGTTYTLEIKGVDIDSDGEEEFFSASTTMPQVLPIDSIVAQRFVTNQFGGYQVLLFAPDPPEQNWYNYKLSINDNPLVKRLSDYTVQSDDFVNDNYIYGLPIAFLNDDDEEEVLYPGDTLRLEVNSITKDYYNFIVEAQSEIFGNNPLFSGPPANVPSNIEGNGLGFFTSYAIDRRELVFQPGSLPF